METTQRLTSVRLPLWTLGIGVVALAVYASPFLTSMLIYDRAAIADGALWRFVTGSLVHYSSAHLGFDLLVFLVAGTMIETSGIRFYPALCLATGAGIGVVLYWAEPSMFHYAGLSGVATAAVVYLCLSGLSEAGIWRWACIAILLGLGIKLGFEFAVERPLFIAAVSNEFIPVPLSHFVGACVALLLFLLGRISVARGKASLDYDSTKMENGVKTHG